MVVKVQEKIEKTRHVENNDKSERKNILRGERNVRYHDSVLPIQKKFFQSRVCVMST